MGCWCSSDFYGLRKCICLTVSLSSDKELSVVLVQNSSKCRQSVLEYRVQKYFVENLLEYRNRPFSFEFQQYSKKTS